MIQVASEEVLYNVHCVDCGSVWQPNQRSPLWWQAKQRAEQGYLDALRVDGQKCGCKQAVHNPEAPYRVFGYNMMCEDFDVPCHTLPEAIRAFREADNGIDIVFIVGVSDAVREKLESKF